MAVGDFADEMQLWKDKMDIFTQNQSKVRFFIQFSTNNDISTRKFSYPFVFSFGSIVAT